MAVIYMLYILVTTTIKTKHVVKPDYFINLIQ